MSNLLSTGRSPAVANLVHYVCDACGFWYTTSVFVRWQRYESQALIAWRCAKTERTRLRAVLVESVRVAGRTKMYSSDFARASVCIKHIVRRVKLHLRVPPGGDGSQGTIKPVSMVMRWAATEAEDQEGGRLSRTVSRSIDAGDDPRKLVSPLLKRTLWARRESGLAGGLIAARSLCA